MKPCEMCRKEFNASDLDFMGRCLDCFKAYVNSPDDHKPNMLFAMMQLKDGKTLSSAHYKDILSREAQPDGRVIRKTGRVFI